MIPGLGRSSGVGHGNPLPGESHGQRSLAGYSPWGCKELDMTEGLSMQKFLLRNDLSFTKCFLYIYWKISGFFILILLIWSLTMIFFSFIFISWRLITLQWFWNLSHSYDKTHLVMKYCHFLYFLIRFTKILSRNCTANL